MVDIGKEIRAELHQQGRTVTWLAQQLDMRRATLYAVFRKNSIDTYLLKRIGQLLNKDFFILLSAEMKNDDCASAYKWTDYGTKVYGLWYECLDVRGYVADIFERYK